MPAIEGEATQQSAVTPGAAGEGAPSPAEGAEGTAGATPGMPVSEGLAKAAGAMEEAAGRAADVKKEIDSKVAELRDLQVTAHRTDKLRKDEEHRAFHNEAQLDALQEEKVALQNLDAMQKVRKGLQQTRETDEELQQAEADIFEQKEKIAASLKRAEKAQRRSNEAQAKMDDLSPNSLVLLKVQI